MLLPDGDPNRRRTVATQVDETAESIGVAIVGGHTEVVPTLDRPLLSMTAFGTTDRFLPSGEVEPGDRLLLTGGAGLEAAGILATDFRERDRRRALREPANRETVSADRGTAGAESETVLTDGEPVREPPRGELYPLWQ